MMSALTGGRLLLLRSTLRSLKPLLVSRALIAMSPRRSCENRGVPTAFGESPIPLGGGTLDELREELRAHVKIIVQHTEADFANKVLEPRHMSDSHVRAMVPLRTDPDLRLQYQTAQGTVRFGKLLEDLDIFSVYICYMHNRETTQRRPSPGSLPRTIVTGCVHRINLNRRILKGEEKTFGMFSYKFDHEEDLILDGHVSWTGTSSLEVTMRIFQMIADDRSCEEKRLEQLLKAKFVFVSRNPRDPTRGVRVHPLVARTPEESVIISEGDTDRQDRQRQVQCSLMNTLPTFEEQALIHEVFLSTVPARDFNFNAFTLPVNKKWIDETTLRNTLICFPENQNIYGKIFGGFLMKQAFELASATTKLHAKTKTDIVAVDDVTFRHSVDIGAVLELTAKIAYTEGPYMQVRVYCEIFDERTFERTTTDTFHFTFRTRDKSFVPIVVPQNYSSGMLYLSGRRHFERAMKYLPQ